MPSGPTEDSFFDGSASGSTPLHSRDGSRALESRLGWEMPAEGPPAVTEVHGLPLVLDATSPTGYKGVSQRSLPPPRRFIASVALADRGQIQLGVLSVQHGARTLISMT